MKDCLEKMDLTVIKLAAAIEAEIQEIEKLYRLGYEDNEEVKNLENVLAKLLDCAPGVEKCPYCGELKRVEFNEDHDESLCSDCAATTPERIVGDEIERKVNGQWVKSFY